MNTTPTAIRVFGAYIFVFSCAPKGGGGFPPSDIHLRCDLDRACLGRSNALQYAAERGDFVHDFSADSKRNGGTAFIINIQCAMAVIEWKERKFKVDD